MKKEPKKKITIEGLAEVVNNLAAAMDKGFNDVNKNFKGVHEKMDKGFDDVYKKMDKGFARAHKEIEDLAIMTGRGFEAVDKRFDKVESRLDKVEIKLGQVDHRLVMVEDNQLDLKLRMDVLSNNNKGVDELRSRVVVLEKKVGVKGV
ncbi:MAG: hypothetical protein HW401_741 [Parcubacteria group bacterium]|nr:hypothetical protein [Parcubacteria group bacterium]